MARSHLTLAALATSAVEGLQVTGSSPLGAGTLGDYDSALVSSADDRHFIVRVPRSERAEAEQSADLGALRALSEGVRGRLPFDVSRYAGQVPVGGTRAVVYEYVYGDPVSLERIPAGDGIAGSIGRSIAAIHALPTSFIADSGLPVRTPADVQRAATVIMDRASATGVVPAALLDRWERGADDAALWQFVPAVVNGGLSADSFLQSGGEVTGVLGWQGLSVDDPAKDLFWVMAARSADVAASVSDAYQQARGIADRQVLQRARLYSELELAKWLLHGKQERSSEIVDDAVSMMHSLVDRVQDDLDQTITHNTMPVLDVDEVEALLEERRQRGEGA